MYAITMIYDVYTKMYDGRVKYFIARVFMCLSFPLEKRT